MHMHICANPPTNEDMHIRIKQTHRDLIHQQGQPQQQKKQESFSSHSAVKAYLEVGVLGRDWVHNVVGGLADQQVPLVGRVHKEWGPVCDAGDPDGQADGCCPSPIVRGCHSGLESDGSFTALLI